MHQSILTAAAALGLLLASSLTTNGAENVKLQRLYDINVYSNKLFYSTFPSIVLKPDGELIVAFRRAPERRAFGEDKITHTDSNAYLVMVRSRDGGKTWNQSPELIYAHPQGGSQDPCLIQLRDGSMLCASYTWAWVDSATLAKKQNVVHYGNFAFLGGYLVRSEDGGKSWSDPIIPPAPSGETRRDIFDRPVPAYNRGALCEGKDGRLYWAVASTTSTNLNHTGTQLFISSDKGRTWQFSCPIVQGEKFSVNETSLYETPKGDLVAFMRSEGFGDKTVVARSTDGGKSFQKWIDTGFQGHPHHAIRLPDNRVLLVYGYRHVPYGIRARVLDPECTQFDSEEIIIRKDGGNGDLGYPWATMVSDDRVLVVYYFNQENGVRHIAGTFLEIQN